MKLIRYNTFETNSSSTHALVIPHSVKDDSYSIYDSLDHNFAFGREESRLVDSYDEKLAYIYLVVNDFRERTSYSKTNPKDSWGHDYGITDEVVSKFKKTVNEAYREVIELTGREPYDNDPTPDDIFYLIDHSDNIKGLDGRDITWHNGRYIEVDFTTVEELGRQLTDEEYLLTAKYDLSDDTVAAICELSYDEQVIARLSHVLPDYVSSNYYRSMYVDHTEDFGSNGFLDVIKKCDKEYIKRMIFSTDSYITVGGDEYRGYNIKTIGFEKDYDGYDEYYENEAGERCPDRESFGDDDDSWNRYWKEREKYTVVRDNGGFNDRLHDYEKDNDVFLKGN